MKRAVLILGVMTLFVSVSCKEKATSKINTDNVAVAAERDEAAKLVPVMSLEKAEHDFGTIEQGTPQETVFKVTNTGNAPLIILVNGASASAAEILAAALQDHGRAIVIGTNSFGKGSVQKVLSMPNTGELILTWAYFQSPHNFPLNEFGILPNICTAHFDDHWLSDDSSFKAQTSDSMEMFDASRKKLRDITPSVTDYRRLCQWHWHYCKI